MPFLAWLGPVLCSGLPGLPAWCPSAPGAAADQGLTLWQPRGWEGSGREPCLFFWDKHTLASGFLFLSLASEVQHPPPCREQGCQEQGHQEEGEMLLSRLGGGCWKSFLSVFLSGAGECPAGPWRGSGARAFNCICPISMSSFGCDPPWWGTSLSEGGRIAVFGNLGIGGGWELTDFNTRLCPCSQLECS